MTKSVSWGIVGALAAALVLGTVLGYFLKPATRFGYIDSSRALTESELGKQYMARIQATGEELIQEFAQLSNEQKAQRQAEFTARQSQLEQELSRKFQSRLNEIAMKLGQEKKLNAVFWHSAMAFGSYDLTDEVINALTAEPTE